LSQLRKLRLRQHTDFKALTGSAFLRTVSNLLSLNATSSLNSRIIRLDAGGDVRLKAGDLRCAGLEMRAEGDEFEHEASDLASSVRFDALASTLLSLFSKTFTFTFTFIANTGALTPSQGPNCRERNIHTVLC
jgi:hypothetical protein